MRRPCELVKTACFVMAGLWLLAHPSGVSAAEDRAGWPKRVAVMGGAPGSTYYACNTGMGEVLKKFLNVDAMVMAAGGGSAPLIAALKKGEADIVIGADGSFFNATVARAEYAGKPKADNLRCIAMGYTLNFPWVARAKSGIKSVEDLKGKTAYIEVETSKIHKAMNLLICEAYGLVPEKDFKSVKFAGQAEVMSAMADGRADVGSYAEITPTSYWLELADQTDIRFLSFSKKAIDYVRSKSDEYIPTTIPGGVYKGNKEPVNTLGIMVGYFATPALPDNFVYAVTKLFYEEPYRSAFVKYNKALEQFSLDKVGSIKTPFHKGAIKYFKEKGAWTAALEARQQELLAIVGAKE